MRHYTIAAFWRLHDQLPEHVQLLAKKNYELLKVDSDAIWIWIGSHENYNKILKRL